MKSAPIQKSQRFRLILDRLSQDSVISASEIVLLTGVDRVTVYRDFQDLIRLGKVEKIGGGKYRKKVSIREFFAVPFYSRSSVSYDPGFLSSYIPGTTSFFSEEQLSLLENAASKAPITTEYYRTNRRNIENALIDLSFSSSFLEGNMYDYLDTEVLIRYNRIAESKTRDETQMILNHKLVIEYVMEYRDQLSYDRMTFFEIHALL